MQVANVIEIYAPRWKDRTVLVAQWKVGNYNKIEITAKKKDGTRYYPEPFYLEAQEIKKYPLKSHTHGNMYEIPLNDLINKE